MIGPLATLCLLLGVSNALPSSPTSSAVATSGKPLPNIEAIKAVSESKFKSYKTGGIHRQPVSKDGVKTKRDAWKCSTQPTYTTGDADTGGKGVTIANAGNDWRGFYIYHNSCDSIPWKYIWIAAGQTQFVSFPDGFEGRIQRGVDQYMLNGQSQPLGSWLEISWDQYGVAWHDVSLIRGCDGGILTWSLDNSGAWKGFTQWILDGAPTGAYDMKNDRQWVIKATEGVNAVINTIPRDWDIAKVGAEYAYVDDSHGSPVVASSNGRVGTYWPEGRA
ncbi:hypothetical protein G7046_g2000 [Stylonectria norvegica]|nr:hypothetical protein G7046_g2000 [Stylonectria norvegica]